MVQYTSTHNTQVGDILRLLALKKEAEKNVYQLTQELHENNKIIHSSLGKSVEFMGLHVRMGYYHTVDKSLMAFIVLFYPQSCNPTEMEIISLQRILIIVTILGFPPQDGCWDKIHSETNSKGSSTTIRYLLHGPQNTLH